MEKFIKLSIVGIIAFFVFDYSEAGERIRFYDTDGKPKPTWEHADKQIDGSWRIYDSKGRYKGKVTRDRFYSKDGRVLHRYYLFNNR